MNPAVIIIAGKFKNAECWLITTAELCKSVSKDDFLAAIDFSAPNHGGFFVA
ncbi:hypothetical protein [Synechococcus sp. MIT S9504]|uniref:hypothetical protein n=1 Tax=Synechococcus sp. MIT S9504 TaxID=1801628 RepID=UPI0018D2DBD7|nr:hypothetical protein [Synechococcus sp. MIT S9504]